MTQKPLAPDVLARVEAFVVRHERQARAYIECILAVDGALRWPDSLSRAQRDLHDARDLRAVLECYALHLDRESQLAEHRAWHHDPPEEHALSVEAVRQRVRDLDAAKYDDEAATGIEADLRESVLKAVAGGAKNARELAVEALKTSKIEFRRGW